MGFIYHRVPQEMVGTTLYPLTMLKEIAPSIYTQAARKYWWRENIMEQKIVTLDCLWNDVLFSSPVHPSKMRDALADLGHTIATDRYFEIDTEMLDPKKSTVYLHRPRKAGPPRERDFAAYDPKTVCEEFGELPDVALRYYRDALINKWRLLLWGYVPHVMTLDPIDVTECRIITV